MIIFQNPGIIDKRSITAFGVSSKENPGAIGYFGTGLKYAIAILLRTGHKVTIFAGDKEMKFGLRKQTIRVNDFQFVTLNGRSLDFTTEVGKNWELWMAFRELYCNCMDEKGQVFQCGQFTKSFHFLSGQTTVVVEGEGFEKVYERRDEVILSTEPIEKHDYVWIHPGPSKFLYYRGVRVLELPTQSLYTYNLQTRMALTEDRTLKESWTAFYYVKTAIMDSRDREVIARTIVARRAWEENLAFDGSPGETFIEEVQKRVSKFDEALNATAMSACRISLNKKLTTATRMDLSQLDQARLEKAISFCRRLGYHVDAYPIIISEFLGEGILGACHDDTIYLSKLVFMEGTKRLAGTLIEEFVHLRHRLHDESRALQNFLVDAVVSIGEQALGEPL